MTEARRGDRATGTHGKAAGAAPASRWALFATWAFDVQLASAVIMLVASLSYAISGRLDAFWPVARTVVTFTAAAGVSFLAAGTYRSVWRYASTADVGRIAKAVGFIYLFFLPVLFVLIGIDGLILAPAALAPAILGGVLILSRAIGRSILSGDVLTAVNRQFHGAPLVILIGDCEIAATMAASARRQRPRPWRPIAIVDLADRHHGRTIAGVKVLRPQHLRAAVSEAQRAGGHPHLALALGAPNPEALDFTLDAAAATGAPVMRRNVDPVGYGALSGLDLADLLSRRPHELDLEDARRLLAGRVALITGAGGTIGSELARQIAQLGAARIIFYDSSEYNLFRIDAELNPARRRETVAILGDVRDREHLRQVMMTYRPHVVLHAAALKHVPLMEANASEAALTNIAGLKNALEAAGASGVRQFVFISTDKAVEPSSVMGATKRVGEMLIRAWQAETELSRAFVRFGNVLGSNGSVAETFDRQIKNGGPVTVTHPAMERYFMTSGEAGGLVLSAAALAARQVTEPAGAFLLDMGAPVRVGLLAERMIKLAGETPGETIKIVYQGLRPGEKLTETLQYDHESVEATDAIGVLRLSSKLVPPPDLLARIEDLLAAARRRDDSAVIAKLAALTGFRPAIGAPSPAKAPAVSTPAGVIEPPTAAAATSEPRFEAAE